MLAKGVHDRVQTCSFVCSARRGERAKGESSRWKGDSRGVSRSTIKFHWPRPRFETYFLVIRMSALSSRERGGKCGSSLECGNGSFLSFDFSRLIFYRTSSDTGRRGLGRIRIYALFYSTTFTQDEIRPIESSTIIQRERGRVIRTELITKWREYIVSRGKIFCAAD